MTKAEYIKQLADLAGVDRDNAAALVEAQSDLVENAMRKGEQVTLPGIGKLHIKRNEARNGRNPRTGEAVAIPARNVIKLKVAGALADAVA